MAIRRAFRNMPKNPAQLDRLFRDVDLPNNEINDETLRDSVACSVIGRSANSTGDPGDIQASTNDRLLARSGNTLAFQQLTAGMVPDDLITYAKIQNVSATDRLLGRFSVGAGDIEEIVCTAAGRALLDDASASDQRTTLGLGTAATQNTGTTGATVPLLNGTNVHASGNFTAFGIGTTAVQQAANPDTSGASLAALETEVNQIKAVLRAFGFIAT